ncbi:MAG TPA: hypothetical protein VJP79_02260, partial [Nitrososphaera sp.]|nr:hypothetical protein [Nitrososphaera sp.]
GVKEIWCACVEAGLPSFSVGAVKEGYLAAKARGVNIRYITEITPANLQHCQEIMGFAELRHLDMVKGNFALSESEYVAGVLEGNTLVSLVRCDVPELVRQQHLVFQTLWDHSEPAAGRITALMSWR